MANVTNSRISLLFLTMRRRVNIIVTFHFPIFGLQGFESHFCEHFWSYA